MKILVTGCYGFIGLQLTLDLLKNNKVYGIDDFFKFFEKIENKT